jgi:DNA-binding beta-propeller fold protein YncE
MKKLFFWMLIVSGCTKELNQEQTTTLSEQETRITTKAWLRIPDQIHFTPPPPPGLYPEGVAFDRFNNRFLVSSFTTGTIGAVAYNGAYTLFIQDPDLHSTLGLKIDEANKHLLVVATSFSLDVSQQLNIAQLRIYDLQTGTLIQVVDLAALRSNVQHLADDLTTDPQGNVYITDAKSPIVYKVDRNSHASVLFENERYAEPPGFPFYWVGFNGIAYNNNGFLIVGFYTEGKLLKIPVNDPDNYSEIQLDDPIASPDGLLISQDGKELLVVDNRYLGDDAEIVRLVSDDKWTSAKRIESFPTGLVSPTTATSDGKDVFVIYSYVHKVFFGTDSPQTEFMIQKLPFENTKAF